MKILKITKFRKTKSLYHRSCKRGIITMRMCAFYPSGNIKWLDEGEAVLPDFSGNSDFIKQSIERDSEEKTVCVVYLAFCPCGKMFFA